MNGSTVVDISIPPPSFKPVPLSLSRISSIVKHPNKSFLTYSIFGHFYLLFTTIYHKCQLFSFQRQFFWTGANTKLTDLQTESNRLSREKQELERKHASQPTNKDRKKFNRTTTEEFLYPEPMSSNSNANSAGKFKIENCVTILDCNYRKNYFYSFIPLLMCSL